MSQNGYKVTWLRESLHCGMVIRELKECVYPTEQPFSVSHPVKYNFQRKCAVEAPGNVFYQTIVKESIVTHGTELQKQLLFQVDFSAIKEGDRYHDISFMRLADGVVGNLHRAIKAREIEGRLLPELTKLKKDMCLVDVKTICQKTNVFCFHGQKYKIYTQGDELVIYVEPV